MTRAKKRRREEQLLCRSPGHGSSPRVCRGKGPDSDNGHGEDLTDTSGRRESEQFQPQREMIR